MVLLLFETILFILVYFLLFNYSLYYDFLFAPALWQNMRNNKKKCEGYVA